MFESMDPKWEAPDPIGGRGIAGTGPLALLADPDYRRIWVAGACVAGIRWIELLAASVYVFGVTGSAFEVSLVVFVRMVPLAFFGGLWGGIATAFSRRALLAGGFAAMAALRGLLGTLALLDMLELWWLFIGLLVAGMIDSSDYPVRRSMGADFAGPDRAAPALAFDQVTNVSTMALGPVTGGALLDVVGLHGAYFVGAALNLAAVGLAVALPRAPATHQARASMFVADLVEGIRHVRSQRVIVAVLAVTLVVNFFVWPFASMVPVIGKERLNLSAWEIGTLMSSIGLGAFIGMMAVSIRYPAGLERFYFFGSTAFMVAVLIFAASDRYAASLAILLASGLGLSGFSAGQALVFLRAAPAFRPRAMGLLTMCIGLGQFGILHIGLLADWLGAVAAVAIVACEGLAAMAVASVVWPELHRRTGPRP